MTLNSTISSVSYETFCPRSDVTELYKIDLSSLFFSSKYYTHFFDSRKHAESPKRRWLFTNRHTVTYQKNLISSASGRVKQVSNNV